MNKMERKKKDLETFSMDMKYEIPVEVELIESCDEYVCNENNFNSDTTSHQDKSFRNYTKMSNFVKPVENLWNEDRGYNAEIKNGHKSKRRKVDMECRVFQEKWTWDYFFVLIEDKPLCLICHKQISVMKGYNLKRHYNTKHPKFEDFKGHMRTDKISSLRKVIAVQETIFSLTNTEAERKCTEAKIKSIEEEIKNREAENESTEVKAKNSAAEKSTAREDESKVAINESSEAEMKNTEGEIKSIEVEKKIAESKKKTEAEKARTEAENVLRASFIISEKIAKHSESYSNGKFIKSCLIEDDGIISSSKCQNVQNISLSRRTVARRIDNLARDIEETLLHRCFKFDTFSLAIDERTDVTGTAQLAVFVRGVDADFNVTEEILGLRPLKDTSRGEDIFHEVTDLMSLFYLRFEKLNGISTNGTPTMVDNKVGLVSCIKQRLNYFNLNPSDLSVFHCIIHEQTVCARSVKFFEVVSKVVFCINFIKSKDRKHRLFQEFLKDVEVEYGKYDVRWLSKGKMLKRFYDLRNEIYTFMKTKGQEISELINNSWVGDLAFLVDLTTHINELNLRLQEDSQLVHQLYGHIKAFQSKIQLWENQLKINNLFHFPTLSKHVGQECGGTSSYAEELHSLNKIFDKRFYEFRCQEPTLSMFSSPFTTDVEKVPNQYQMELLELQSSEELKRKMNNTSLLEFYKTLPKNKFPKLVNFAKKELCLFGSTNKCEQLFSRMKLIKSKARTRLSDSHLLNNLRLATSNIAPNIDALVKKSQPQISH